MRILLALAILFFFLLSAGQPSQAVDEESIASCINSSNYPNLIRIVDSGGETFITDMPTIHAMLDTLYAVAPSVSGHMVEEWYIYYAAPNAVGTLVGYVKARGSGSNPEYYIVKSPYAAYPDDYLVTRCRLDLAIQ